MEDGRIKFVGFGLSVGVTDVLSSHRHRFRAAWVKSQRESVGEKGEQWWLATHPLADLWLLRGQESVFAVSLGGPGERVYVRGPQRGVKVKGR